MRESYRRRSQDILECCAQKSWILVFRVYLAFETVPEDVVREARTVGRVEGFRTRAPDLVEVFRSLTTKTAQS
jgi:hypothetical protein